MSNVHADRRLLTALQRGYWSPMSLGCSLEIKVLLLRYTCSLNAGRWQVMTGWRPTTFFMWRHLPMNPEKRLAGTRVPSCRISRLQDVTEQNYKYSLIYQYLFYLVTGFLSYALVIIYLFYLFTYTLMRGSIFTHGEWDRPWADYF